MPKDWRPRFWAKVEQTESCWLWTATKNDAGYGQLRVEGVLLYAHRLSYEMAKGPIPTGLIIDHLCRTPRCVRPDHLEAVTQAVNVLRGEAPCAISVRTNRCANGHDMSDAYTVRRQGVVAGRRCRTCALERRRQLETVVAGTRNDKRRRLFQDDLTEMRRLWNQGKTFREIAPMFGVAQSTAREAIRGISKWAES